ncbi:MAG: hypothetical protein KDD35_10785, partial [Bdellovibrionales bacterium]|nr:hypothetical protein [Bdellovibrionales bacterium]
LFPTQYRLNDYPLENSKMTSLKEKMAYFERVLKMRPLKAEASLNLFFEEAYAAEQGFFRGLGASMGLVTTYVDEDKPGGKQAVSFLQGLDAWEKEKFKYKSSATATTVDLQCQGDDVKLRVVTPDYLSIDHEEVIYRFPLNTGMSRAMGNIDVEFVSQDKTSTCEEIKAAKSSPCRWRTAVTTNVFNEGDYEKHFSGLLSGGGSKDLQEKYFGRILPLGVLEAAKSCCTRDLRDSTQCAAIVADNRGDKSMIAAEPAGAKTKTTGAR